MSLGDHTRRNATQVPENVCPQTTCRLRAPLARAFVAPRCLPADGSTSRCAVVQHVAVGEHKPRGEPHWRTFLVSRTATRLPG
jgi:hypothetical protein